MSTERLAEYHLRKGAKAELKEEQEMAAKKSAKAAFEAKAKEILEKQKAAKPAKGKRGPGRPRKHPKLSEEKMRWSFADGKKVTLKRTAYEVKHGLRPLPVLKYYADNLKATIEKREKADPER